MLPDLLALRRALALRLYPEPDREPASLRAEIDALRGALSIAQKAAKTNEELRRRLADVERDAQQLRTGWQADREELERRLDQVRELSRGKQVLQEIVDRASHLLPEQERLEEQLAELKTALRELANSKPVLLFRSGEKRCTFCEAIQITPEQGPRCKPTCPRVVALRLAEGPCLDKLSVGRICERWHGHESVHFCDDRIWRQAGA